MPLSRKHFSPGPEAQITPPMLYPAWPWAPVVGDLKNAATDSTDFHGAGRLFWLSYPWEPMTPAAELALQWPTTNGACVLR